MENIIFLQSTQHPGWAGPVGMGLAANTYKGGGS